MKTCETCYFGQSYCAIVFSLRDGESCESWQPRIVIIQDEEMGEGAR